MRLLYFAAVRERIGTGEEVVSPPPSVRTVADLVDWLKGHSAGHAAAFADVTRLRAAIDQRFAPLDSELGDAGEVALFPPVTGG